MDARRLDLMVCLKLCCIFSTELVIFLFEDARDVGAMIFVLFIELIEGVSPLYSFESL